MRKKCWCPPTCSSHIRERDDRETLLSPESGERDQLLPDNFWVPEPEPLPDQFLEKLPDRDYYLERSLGLPNLRVPHKRQTVAPDYYQEAEENQGFVPMPVPEGVFSPPVQDTSQWITIYNDTPAGFLIWIGALGCIKPIDNLPFLCEKTFIPSGLTRQFALVAKLPTEKKAYPWVIFKTKDDRMCLQAVEFNSNYPVSYFLNPGNKKRYCSPKKVATLFDYYTFLNNALWHIGLITGPLKLIAKPVQWLLP